MCGTDEHGTPVTVTADAEGVSPKKIVEKYHKMHLDAFNGIGVEFDNFSGTARPDHFKLSQEFFKKVEENGFIHRETVERPYCPDCDRYLPDRYRGVDGDGRVGTVNVEGDGDPIHQPDNWHHNQKGESDNVHDPVNMAFYSREPEDQMDECTG